MGYPLPWSYRNAPRPQAQPAPQLGAGAALMAGEAAFADRDFGLGSGEMLPRPKAQPQRPPEPAGLTIPPPPWSEQLASGDFDLASLTIVEPEPAPPTALEVMKINGDDLDWPEPNLEPPEVVEPLRPLKLPEPDWREEERLIERATRAAEVVEEAPARYPPARREPL